MPTSSTFKSSKLIFSIEKIPKIPDTKKNQKISNSNEGKKELNNASKIENSQNFKCPFKDCEKTFSCQYRLRIHSRTHEGEKPYACEICEKRFNEKGNLKTHMLIHTGEKPYSCQVKSCNKKFRTYGHLRDHLSTHFDMRNFHCKLCGASFSRKWSLKKHSFTHTGEKPFSCDLCSKQFSDKSNMTTHFKTQHKQNKKSKVTSGQIQTKDDLEQQETEKYAPLGSEMKDLCDFSRNSEKSIEQINEITSQIAQKEINLYFPLFNEKSIEKINSGNNLNLSTDHLDHQGHKEENMYPVSIHDSTNTVYGSFGHLSVLEHPSLFFDSPSHLGDFDDGDENESVYGFFKLP